MMRLLQLIALVALAVPTLSVRAAAPASPQLDLQVDLDPESRRIAVVARFDAPRDFRLRLPRAFTVRELRVDDRQYAVRPPSVAGDYAVWALPYDRGGKVELRYDGELAPLDRQLDHRGVLRALRPMASPEGTFLPASTLWHPRPLPLFTYRVTLTLPGAQRGLVGGDLVEEQAPADATAKYRAVFDMSAPTDGIDLMAGPYVIDERRIARNGHDDLRLRTYFMPALQPLADDYLADSMRYVERYAKAIGPYPYRSFSVVASPLPTGFGMPTLTYIGADVLKLPFIRATSLGHEVLHNWWGNGVYPDWASGNWSEGLTTFMADYAYKEAESAAAARDMRVGWLRDLATTPAELQTPLAQFRSRTHGAAAAVGYGKSAMLFLMLRDLIGAEAFDRALRDFWTQHRFRTASWSDLQKAFEKSAGRPLQRFFAQWLERADAPQLTLAAAAAARSARGWDLQLQVRQQAQTPYALRVPVDIAYGSRTEMHWLDLDRAEQTVTLATTAQPTAVKLDPDVRVWRRLLADELPPILRLWFTSAAPQYHVSGADARLARSAERLVRRLFEHAPAAPSTLALTGTRDPLLIVGLHGDVEALLAGAGLPSRPQTLPKNATAYVWTIERRPPDARPIAVISVRDLAALDALQRPLPHYGAQSWLAFQDEKAIARGVWPVATPAAGVVAK